MKVLGAGERRHLVTIMKRSITTVNLESTPTYTALPVSRWVKIEPLSSRELLLAGASQVYSEVTHRLTFLFTTDISQKDQIKFGNRTFEVVGKPINEDEQNIQTVCMCVERT